MQRRLPRKPCCMPVTTRRSDEKPTFGIDLDRPVDKTHHRLLASEGDREAAGTFEPLPRVLPGPEGDKEWRLYVARAGLPIGLRATARLVSLTTTNRPSPPHHFHS
jgi:hypothetical protein